MLSSSVWSSGIKDNEVCVCVLLQPLERDSTLCRSIFLQQIRYFHLHYAAS